MDPQSPAPTPTPAPEQPAPTPAPQGQSPKKLSKGALFSIIGGVLFAILLIITIVVTVQTMSGDDTAKSNNRGESSKTATTDKETTEPNPEVSGITAKALVELRAACVGGSVENAGALTKPYKYVVYENNNSQSAEKETWKWDMYAVGANDESIPLDFKSAPSELNVVVCLDRDDSTAVKTMTCELQRGAYMEASESTVADYFAVKYKMTLYEAQSGKKLKELAAINGPATECPAGFYNKESPNIYGDPDASELDARLKSFEQ
ncbi:MAG: hypothetical protein ACREGE_00950 [Candidatus Microsaccharimonas sp.]